MQWPYSSSLQFIRLPQSRRLKMEGSGRNGMPGSPHELSRNFPPGSPVTSSSLPSPWVRRDSQVSLTHYDELLLALLRRDLAQGAARSHSELHLASTSSNVTPTQASSFLQGLLLQNQLRQAQAQAQAQATTGQGLLVALAQAMARQTPAPAAGPTGAVDAMLAVSRQLLSTSLPGSSVASTAGAHDARVPVAVVSIPASSVRDVDSQDSSLAATDESAPRAVREARYQRRPRTMANSRDLDALSEYQCLLREQMEFFEATPDDTKVTAQGRNKPIFLGQVGIQCKHCAHLPPKQRRRGAVYFPARLESIYQSAQNMGTNHFNGRCPHIPKAVGDHLGLLKVQKSFNNGGGKIYWADKAAAAGVIEHDDGLVFG